MGGRNQQNRSITNNSKKTSKDMRRSSIRMDQNRPATPWANNPQNNGQPQKPKHQKRRKTTHRSRNNKGNQGHESQSTNKRKEREKRARKRSKTNDEGARTDQNPAAEHIRWNIKPYKTREGLVTTFNIGPRGWGKETKELVLNILERGKPIILMIQDTRQTLGRNQRPNELPIGLHERLMHQGNGTRPT